MKCRTPEELANVRKFYLDTLGLKICREWPDGMMIDTGNGPLGEQVEFYMERLD